MKHHSLNHMIKGWFVGDFQPTALHHKDVEVGIKHYKAGDCEPTHVHRIATELTAIVQGHVKMGGQLFKAGDIITITPGEATDFQAVTDAITVVVKTPSVPSDKYLV